MVFDGAVTTTPSTPTGPTGSAPARAPEPTTRLARLAGLAAAAVGLGVGELVAATGTSGQSLVGSVGGEIIDQAPGALVRTGIDALGTADKPVLVATIVAVCLLLGAVLGPAARRRPWLGPLAFGVMALLGAAAGLRDPLADDAVTVMAAVSAAVAGSFTLWLLERRLPSDAAAGAATVVVVHADDDEDAPGPAPTLPRPGVGAADRRTFLAWTGTAAGVGVLAALGGKALSGRSATSAAQATVDIPLPAPTATLPGTPAGTQVAGLAVDGLSPLITPNSSFYRIDTALTLPRPDLDGWHLRFSGEIDNPFSLTYRELLELPTIEAPVTIACVSNKVGGDLVGTAVWQGVPLADLLERAGVKPGGTQVVGRSLDGFTVGFPTEVALDGRTAMVAVGMNGEPLPVLHGFPARLIVEGLYGYVSATKWLSTIELKGWDDFDAYWIDLGWAKEGPIKTQSRIDVPRGGTKVDAGEVAVAGVAWAPGRGITKVEVQVDDGPWNEAELGPGLSDATWRQWVYRWDATPGDHKVRVRATDGDGETQTGDVAPVEPDGATGWHTRTVGVRG
jgi:DMSO/TMAO reductase YedYZ molybdopterin-dependent catalytic subunit